MTPSPAAAAASTLLRRAAVSARSAQQQQQPACRFCISAQRGIASSSPSSQAYGSASRCSRALPPTQQHTRLLSRSDRLGSNSSRRSRRTYATSPSAASSLHDPATVEAQRLVEQGTQHLESQDIAQARKAYEASLAVQPSANAHFNLGVCKYHDRDLPGAIDEWKECIRLSELSGDGEGAHDAHTNIASAYAMSSPSRPDLAVQHLK